MTKASLIATVFHRTKFHVSVFLKRDGNIELNISVTFMFCETCNTKSWRFYQISVLNPERKHQVMFPSLLSQDGSAIVCFRYVSANGILISMNLGWENKIPMMVLCILVFWWNWNFSKLNCRHECRNQL